MQKKTKYLLLFIAISVGIFFFLNNKKISTLAANEKDFGYKNTGNIDKIFITNRANKEYVTITKKDNKTWIVNDKYEANWSQVDIVLSTLRAMQVKKPVGAAELEGVKQKLSTNGTKVEIYENGSLSKTFYVGGNTSDETGTYFYMEGAKEPYVCHIPGFTGYLSTRFFTNLNAWRSRNVFKTIADNIISIKVDWLQQPQQSFEIINKDKLPTLISNGKALENNTVVNANKLKSYLSGWENLSYAGIMEFTPRAVDSIVRTQPFLVLSLTDNTQKTTTLTLYKMAVGERSHNQMDDNGNPLNFETQNFYAIVNNSKTELVQIQDFVFGKVMKPKDYFLMKK